MSQAPKVETLLTPESLGYARRLLGWRAILALAVLAFYTGWGLYVADAADDAQRESDQRTTWLHELQWAEHDLLSNEPDAPQIRDAFARITRVSQEIDRHSGVSSTTARLGATVAQLQDTLNIEGERDRARSDLLNAIHEQTRGLFEELHTLQSRERFRWKQLWYLTISAIAMASVALMAMLLARHRRLLAEHLQQRLEAAIHEADAARQEAQRASSAKSRFLATVSHELRTPMTAILGTVDLLGKTDLSSRQADYLTAVRSSGETLQRLIDDVLDLSRIEAGRLELSDEPFSLYDLLDGLALMLGGRAEMAGIELSFRVEPAVPAEVRGDSLRLRQVLVNLLGNALKFTARGSIELRVSRVPQHADQLRFEVQDTGPGLRPDQIERIFEPFTQADSSLTRTHGGAGLGLAICRHLVRNMGGSLGVRSEPGDGATFHFTCALPETGAAPSLDEGGPVVLAGTHSALGAVAAQLDRWKIAHLRAETPEQTWALLDRVGSQPPGTLLLDEDMPRPQHPALLTWRALRLLPFSAAGGSTEPGITRNLITPVRPSLVRSLLDPASDHAMLPSWEPTPIAGGHRVLVVDDNEMNRLVLAEMLVTMSCRVTLAHGGQQAIERATAEPFDLIFMDSEMPDMDGFETTRRLREAGIAPEKTPILGLSGHVTPEHRQRGLAAGMDEYLAKPIQLATLQRAVRRWCEERER